MDDTNGSPGEERERKGSACKTEREREESARGECVKESVEDVQLDVFSRPVLTSVNGFRPTDMLYSSESFPPKAPMHLIVSSRPFISKWINESVQRERERERVCERERVKTYLEGSQVSRRVSMRPGPFAFRAYHLEVWIRAIGQEVGEAWQG